MIRPLTDLRIHNASSELYGSDRSLVSLVREAARRGSSVDVLVPARGPLIESLTAAGASVEVSPEVILRRSRPMRTARDIIWDGVRRYGTRDFAPARLVVSNTSTVLTPFFTERHAAPWVVIVREFYSSVLERKAFQAILSRAAGIVCVSDSVRSQFDKSFLDRLPTTVVHSGADIREFQAIDRSTRVSREQDHRILCVGRLLPWKGQDLLLDALALMPPQLGQLSVRFVGAEFGGTGELTADLRRKSASLPPHITVEFPGESPQIVDHYAWADVVVVPSRKPEPFGKVVIEGLASGCAVVACGHGGPSEVIEHGTTGLLFEPGNAEDLASAITKLVSSPALLQDVSLAGRAASSNWSGDAAAAKILDFFGSLTPKLL